MIRSYYRVISSLICSFPAVFSSISSMAAENQCQRLLDIDGLENRRNEIIYYPASTSEDSERSVVIYFGGDIQDYRENMEKHRDNRRYAQEWNLEATAVLLSKKFPSSRILIFKANRMYLGSFACFSNFVPCNDIGAPTQDPPVDFRSWEHLKLLLDNIGHRTTPTSKFSESNVTLIGFSKGAVVLNQLVYEISHIADGSVADQMINRIRAWYWLDGAHSGSKKTWITDVNALEKFADRIQAVGARVYAHVTPRQVRDPGRPWVGEEEAKFSRFLERRLPELFMRKLHFENESPSLEQHFRILNLFEPDAAV